MPGDIYRQAQPGEPLDIPAALFNKLVGIAKGDDFDDQGADGFTLGRSQTVVKVRNDSGANRSKFEILGINGPAITPTDNLDEFKRQVFFKGITPTLVSHAFKYVVLLEPLFDGMIGRAVVAGVVPVKITGANDATFAGITDSDCAKLTASGAGSCRVLYTEAGTGDRWAIVRLGEREETHFLHVTSTTKTAGAYPANRCDLDPTSDPQTWTEREACWIKSRNTNQLLCVGPTDTSNWPAKLVGVKSSDGKFIYEALDFMDHIMGTFASTLTQGSSQTLTMSDGQTVTVWDNLLLSGQTIAAGVEVHADWDRITGKYWLSSAACASS